jgi:hypothetical protein
VADAGNTSNRNSTFRIGLEILMNLLVTPVLVVFIGLIVRSRLIATLLYLVIEAILFTFQTLTVLLGWLGGELTVFEDGMFGPTPTGLPLVLDEGDLWSYGLVNLAIMVVGVALIVVIVTLRNRSRAKRTAATVS